ncbi:MAG: DUF177 domain-containing protein [Verrucomicrobia bacterium]|nr:DUF177 domain-containing protein [Verrucomicrobiota bacterium]
MIIRLVEIPESGRAYAGDLSAEALDIIATETLALAAPVHVEVTATLVPGALLVRGSLSTELAYPCSRCNAATRVPLTVPRFEAVWTLSTDGDQPPQRVEDELDMSIRPNASELESVDLTPDLREAIILAFPAYPVCRSDCKGLCARCGKNLNDSACSCRAPDDNRWSALDHLEIG